MIRRRHLLLGSIGTFEIWATPAGRFEVYSATARVAVRNSLAGAFQSAGVGGQGRL